MATPTEGSRSSSKVIPAQCVRVGGSKGKLDTLPTLAAHEKKPAEPRVKLTKDGDTVTAIEITCTCGAVIRLDCEY